MLTSRPTLSEFSMLDIGRIALETPIFGRCVLGLFDYKSLTFGHSIYAQFWSGTPWLAHFWVHVCRASAIECGGRWETSRPSAEDGCF